MRPAGKGVILSAGKGGKRMVVWAAIAAAAVVGVLAIVALARRRGRDDALDYEDFVELGRAAWVDLRDDDRNRLAK